MKATKSWLGWLLPWVVWVLSTALGWLLGWAVSAGTTMASGIWDPDEVEAYLNSLPWERLFEALVFGAIFGLILGVVLGLVQWLLLRRRARDVVFFVLATIVGSVLICYAARIGPAQVESRFTIMLRAGAVGGAIGGGFMGLVQWIILRRRVRRADGWILLTAVSWAMGWAVTWTLWDTRFLFASPSGVVDEPYITGQIFSLAAPFVGGAIVGLGQWLLLRHNVQRAGWWIPATAVSWGIAYFSTAILGDLMFAPGAVAGVITATTLVLLCTTNLHNLCHPCP